MRIVSARKGDLGQNLRQILCMPYFQLQSYTFCHVLAKTMYDLFISKLYMFYKVASVTTYEKMERGRKSPEGEGVEREREREREKESPFLFMHCHLLMV